MKLNLGGPLRPTSFRGLGGPLRPTSFRGCLWRTCRGVFSMVLMAELVDSVRDSLMESLWTSFCQSLAGSLWRRGS